ncbi:hypothetical protein CHRYSEO8AT_540069 [Chryseobacterium sp. 8AT]|nr:hypothetical protein CHRYSEO8AT_540069 [Chryseobacterium sp. 8AT]
MTLKYKKSIKFAILKENINNILIRKPFKILKIKQHEKQQPISFILKFFKKEKQKIHRKKLITS